MSASVFGGELTEKSDFESTQDDRRKLEKKGVQEMIYSQHEQNTSLGYSANSSKGSGKASFHKFEIN